MKKYWVVCFFNQKHRHYITKKGKATRNIARAAKWRRKIWARLYCWALTKYDGRHVYKVLQATFNCE